MHNNQADSPDHPIIDRPHEYEIVRFDFHNDPRDGRNSYLDMTLQKETVVRRLRFFRPRRLVVEDGFPAHTHGMMILDIRERQLDDLRVEVADFEASHGRVTFFAADVIDLDV
jgi:hypothetical protein